RADRLRSRGIDRADGDATAPRCACRRAPARRLAARCRLTRRPGGLGAPRRLAAHRDRGHGAGAPGRRAAGRAVRADGSAGPAQGTVRILLPLVAPAVALAALVVFALALTELGVPMFLRVPVYPAAVFARLGGVRYAPGEAFALVLPLIAVALAVLACERLVARRAVPTLGLAIARPPVRLGRWRTAGALAAWLAAGLAVAPLAALAVRAGGDGWRAVPLWVGASVGNSLLAAGAGATII